MQHYPFHKEFKIHWGDIDSLGHVNHTRYLVWFETIRCQFMDELGIEVQGRGEIGPILANLNVNYHAPLYFPDTITVGLRISKIGNSSFVLEYAATRTQAPSEVVCDASTVLVLFNYKKHCKELITDEIKRKMQIYLHK